MTEDMEFKDQEARESWEKDVAANSDDAYGRAILAYARRWVSLMEAELTAPGVTVADIAQSTSNEADTEGITGFMYGCAVSALCRAWKHGEELRRWHNRQYGVPDDKEGVVNPAVLTVERS